MNLLTSEVGATGRFSGLPQLLRNFLKALANLVNVMAKVSRRGPSLHSSDVGSADDVLDALKVATYGAAIAAYALSEYSCGFSGHHETLSAALDDVHDTDTAMMEGEVHIYQQACYTTSPSLEDAGVHYHKHPLLRDRKSKCNSCAVRDTQDEQDNTFTIAGDEATLLGLSVVGRGAEKDSSESITTGQLQTHPALTDVTAESEHSEQLNEKAGVIFPSSGDLNSIEKSPEYTQTPNTNASEATEHKCAISLLKSTHQRPPALKGSSTSGWQRSLDDSAIESPWLMPAMYEQDTNNRPSPVGAFCEHDCLHQRNNRKVMSTGFSVCQAVEDVAVMKDEGRFQRKKGVTAEENLLPKRVYIGGPDHRVEHDDVGIGISSRNSRLEELLSRDHINSCTSECFQISNQIDCKMPHPVAKCRMLGSVRKECLDS
jgi:hypothetical protein